MPENTLREAANYVIPKEVEVLLQDILMLAMGVNIRTAHTVFVWYSGHIDDFVIDIHEGGWTPNSHPTTTQRLSYMGKLNSGGSTEYTLDTLEAMKTMLLNYLSEDGEDDDR